ncbi:hypothetical protein GUJ93_ZPchr0004g39633 [Zizania palustris]|uniref:Uncharacterized protein n=1 Tax=Zizania palustris TaxID=103762 RepID=A0A8J5SDZ1_ZIZPA|nr:hypothetical protein GUJ93_ZPchr0004g39633 [Zizania palustris]
MEPGERRGTAGTGGAGASCRAALTGRRCGGDGWRRRVVGAAGTAGAGVEGRVAPARQGGRRRRGVRTASGWRGRPALGPAAGTSGGGGDRSAGGDGRLAGMGGDGAPTGTGGASEAGPARRGGVCGAEGCRTESSDQRGG